MAAKRKDEGASDASEAATKLSRLLQTENELEAMLADARQQAKQLVESAHASAEAQRQRFESEIEAGDAEVRDRIARARDDQIESIRERTRQKTNRLRALDDTKITELAHHVLDLLLDRSGSGGAR
jgi:vacuolar-type H+-ATPase subunit H